MAAGESGDTAAADAAVVPPSLPIPVADVAVEPGTAAAAAAAADEVATAPSAAAAAAAEPVSAAAAAAAPRTMRHPPTVLANGMEVSVHSVPRLLRYDLGQVLPGVRHDGLLIVTVCQRAAMDLVATGADVAAEKDALLEKFVAWARRVQTLLQDRAGAGGGGRSDDAWATWVDPCSGLPVDSPNQHVIYPEVDTMELLLRYRTESAGPCKILLHPRWGSHVYPATMFATAPLDRVIAAAVAAGAHIS